MGFLGRLGRAGQGECATSGTGLTSSRVSLAEEPGGSALLIRVRELSVLLVMRLLKSGATIPE